MLRKFDINSLYICPPHLYTVATLPWEIQKVTFDSIVHAYFRLFTLSQKKTNCYSLTHHTWKMSPHYLVKCTTISSFSFFTRIEYQSVIRTSCGSVLLRHGLNFSRAWWMMQLISDEKDWKHVSVQKVVTLNICCNVACLTFHLPHVTTSFFQTHQCQPANGFFSEPLTFGGIEHTFSEFSQMKKLCILQTSAVTFFRCGG